CGSAIASSSLATEWIKGKKIDDAETIKNTAIVEELNLPPVKIHCSVLAEDAIKSAIADFRAKQAARRELEGQGAASEVSASPAKGGRDDDRARCAREQPACRGAEVHLRAHARSGAQALRVAEEARNARRGAARRRARRRLRGLRLRARVRRRP